MNGQPFESKRSRHVMASHRRLTKWFHHAAFMRCFELPKLNTSYLTILFCQMKGRMVSRFCVRQGFANKKVRPQYITCFQFCVACVHMRGSGSLVLGLVPFAMSPGLKQNGIIKERGNIFCHWRCQHSMPLQFQALPSMGSTSGALEVCHSRYPPENGQYGFSPP
jgi:hypothetical protein